MAATANTKPAKSNGSNGTDVSDATTEISEQLNALRSDFAGLAAAVQNLAGSSVAAAKNTTKEKLADANEAGEQAANRAMNEANEGIAAITNYARQKPMVALAAVAGAGLLIGLLTAPRK